MTYVPCEADGPVRGAILHCSLPFGHPGSHYDMQSGIYWQYPIPLENLQTSELPPGLLEQKP